ncbi:HSPB1 [Cordylochernes scorpioides]|uniref:HSPB1 n=1 Tax=Cordylochernes scorpioides TaxID=51811 RepID=A0ABY6KWS4_9ARAC|nr:HSPB1 [Cordylochernes scorpioides]
MYDFPRPPCRHRRMDSPSLLRGPLDWPSLRTSPLDDLLHLSLAPLRHQASRCGRSEVVNSADKFQVQLDVSHYRPEELSVKTVDGAVVIRGKHEEKQDEHGWVSREFSRRYMLPPDVDPHALTSTLTAEGVLTLEAPKHQPEQPQEHAVPITVEQGTSVGVEDKKAE